MSSSSRFEDKLIPGSHYANRFVIERILGRGGMGVVFAARHIELDELVAVKVMLPEVAANAETAARFFREARASVRIKSDYVVRVLDVAYQDDKTPYMVMEYLEGSDLDALLEREGPLPVTQATRYLIEAADAVAAAHSIGIVHRDLKPQNLFLARQGDDSLRIKVLDFGISKLSEPLSQLDAALTQTSSVMGSPLYMSPEQMQSAKTVDQRSDIWALGCVLFELVTGKPPFSAASVPELCAAVFTRATPIASHARPGFPKALDSVIARCLEKSPDQRYATVAQLARDLLQFTPDAAPLVAGIHRRRSSMPPPTSTAAAQSVTSLQTAVVTTSNWGQVTGRTLLKRSRVVTWWLLAGVALLCAIGTYSFWSWRHRSTGSVTVASAAVNIQRSGDRQAAAAVSLQQLNGVSEPPQQQVLDAGTTPSDAPTTLQARSASSPVPLKGASPRRATSALPDAAAAQSAAPTNKDAHKSNELASAPANAPSLKIDIK